MNLYLIFLLVVGTAHSLCSKPKLQLSINQTLINQVEEAKLLGIIIDNRLSWDKHVQKLVSEMENI